MEKLLNQILQKKLLIFDFDGTLADTSPLHFLAFKKTLAKYDLNFTYDELAGLATNEALAYILNKNNVPFTKKKLELLTHEKQSYVKKLISSDLKPINGLNQFLDWAYNKFSLCIVSSGSSANINAAIKKLGYNNYFDPIISIDDVNFSKPNPEGFMLALKTKSILARHALIFEDSVTGFEAAKRAKIDFVDVNFLDWHELYTQTL
tara:strand:- start:712 stop:1329 length:618 start_codon:yes stop_codon:yes gene_type:complete